MTGERFGQFLFLAAVLTIVGFTVSVTLTPPDPYSQALTNLALFPIVLVGSYAFAYKTELTLR